MKNENIDISDLLNGEIFEIFLTNIAFEATESTKPIQLIRKPKKLHQNFNFIYSHLVHHFQNRLFNDDFLNLQFITFRKRH